jgi:hypothetical protein
MTTTQKAGSRSSTREADDVTDYVDANGDPIPASAFEADHEVRKPPLTKEQLAAFDAETERLRKFKPA